MKILWIVNMVLPPLAKHLGMKHGLSGTWMFDIADKLNQDPNVEFAVACVHGKEFAKYEVGNTTYYCLPGAGKQMIFYQKKFEEYWRRIVNDFHPDLVHVHGTEYCHALSFIRTHKQIKTIIALQGVLTRIKDKDFGGLSFGEIIRNKTLREWIRNNGIFEQHLFHVKNAKSEQEMLRAVKYCMAVDDWHASMAMSINPDLKIFKVDYNLRDAFYNSPKWDIRNINRYIISSNPGGTALKGIHNLLKAVAMVKRDFPQVKVRVPGMAADRNGLIPNSGYAKYLRRLIKSLNIEGNVEFLGTQTAEQMLDNMLHAHIQVVPSSIEGPSLVLREGMHLGVPTIASFRGGMADFVEDKVNGFLYDFDEVQYLALRIRQIFGNDDLAQSLSKHAIEKAEKAHNQETNYRNYLTMYRAVIND